MAGLYGHELANRSTSETIYGLSWGPILADAHPAGRTIAAVYSRRSQVALIDGLQLMHPVQLLLRAVKVATDCFRAINIGRRQSVGRDCQFGRQGSSRRRGATRHVADQGRLYLA
jgi:hypothetical protein